MLSLDLALGRLQLQVDENTSKKHSKGEKEEEEEEGASALPDSAAAFVVSDCQRVMVLRCQTLQKPQHCCISVLDFCILQLFSMKDGGRSVLCPAEFIALGPGNLPKCMGHSK